MRLFSKRGRILPLNGGVGEIGVVPFALSLEGERYSSPLPLGGLGRGTLGDFSEWRGVVGKPAPGSGPGRPITFFACAKKVIKENTPCRASLRLPSVE